MATVTIPAINGKRLPRAAASTIEPSASCAFAVNAKNSPPASPTRRRRCADRSSYRDKRSLAGWSMAIMATGTIPGAISPSPRMPPMATAAVASPTAMTTASNISPTRLAGWISWTARLAINAQRSAPPDDVHDAIGR